MASTKKSYTGLAILTAIAASLCCITPVLVLVAGIGGMASTFSWLEPFRPYLIGLTVLMLGIAWYQKLKPAKEVDCDCEADQPDGKPARSSFLQTKTFLAIVTVFAALMLTFPSYAHIFYPSSEVSNSEINEAHLEQANFAITGMTCTGCEEHVTHAVTELEGIQSVETSYEKGMATVAWDNSKTSKAAITEAINATSYQVIQ